MTAYNKKYIYAVYKGDEFICDGTADEICKQLGIKFKTFQFYRTNHYRKTRAEKGKKRKVIIRINGEDKIYGLQ